LLANIELSNFAPPEILRPNCVGGKFVNESRVWEVLAKNTKAVLHANRLASAA